MKKRKSSGAKHMKKRKASGAKHMKKSKPTENLEDTIMRVFGARTWQSKQQVIEKYQTALLTEDVEPILASWIEEYKDNEDVAYDLTYHRDLLRLCREKGINVAFTEYASRPKPGSKIARQFRELPPEIRNRLKEAKTAQEIYAVLADHPDILSLFAQALGQYSEDKETSLRAKLIAWMDAPKWVESQKYLEKHPELMCDEIEEVLEEYIKKLESDGDQQAVEMFSGYLILLRQCRKDGIKSVYGEIHRQTQMDEMNEILKDVEPELADKVRSAQSHEELRELLYEHPELGDAVNEVMRKAFGILLQTEENLQAKFMYWAATPDPDEAQKYLEENPDLLSDEADEMIEGMIERAHKSNNVQIIPGLTGRRDVLRLCREIGIEATFAQFARPNQFTLKPLLQKITPDMLANIPLELIDRLEAVQSDEELLSLIRENPEIVPVLAQVGAYIAS